MTLNGLLMSARELLIDIERTEIEHVLSITQDVGPTDSSRLTSSPLGTNASLIASSSKSAHNDAHKQLLLQQVDQYREALVTEQQVCEQLREENARLAADLRSLAAQLKQERAASNAFLASQATGVAEEASSLSIRDGDANTSGLTLASAASQILLLRREVKFLQKQWRSARVDQDAATTREQMQLLREEAEEAKRHATAAENAASATSTKSRLLLRELHAARSQVRAQHARMLRRSAAQHEVTQLKEQLAKLQDANTVQQQALKQLQLRERLRRPDFDDDDDADCMNSQMSLASAEHDEVAHTGVGLILLSAELTLLERAWMAEKGAAAELVAIKANMSFRIAQAEDDNSSLQAEVGRLKAKVTALQEEKEVMQTSLNALNVDLLTMPEEQQQMAAEAAAAASELTQPALVAGTMSKGSSTADKSIAAMKAMSKLRFGKKKPLDVPPPPR